jgi:hypothetical protein
MGWLCNSSRVSNGNSILLGEIRLCCCRQNTSWSNEWIGFGLADTTGCWVCVLRARNYCRCWNRVTVSYTF